MIESKQQSGVSGTFFLFVFASRFYFVVVERGEFGKFPVVVVVVVVWGRRYFCCISFSDCGLLVEPGVS